MSVYERPLDLIYYTSKCCTRVWCDLASSLSLKGVDYVVFRGVSRFDAGVYLTLSVGVCVVFLMLISHIYFGSANLLFCGYDSYILETGR